MIENPIHSCLRPLSVYNRYSHEYLLLPCGKCSACLNNRSSRYKRLCELESMGSYNVTYFMTLTYDDNHVPKACIVPIGDDRYHLVVKQCDSIDSGTLLSVDPVEIKPDSLAYINSKTTFDDNVISFLCYRDIQLYLKRIRKFLSKNYDADFRFFCSGEYGPETYRAHWHCILFFKKKLPPIIKRDLFKLWGKCSFRRFEFDLSKGGCVSYSAAYSNSSSVLPNLYKGFKIQPFTRHSVLLGFETFKEQLLPKIDNVLSDDQAHECVEPSSIDGCSYRVSRRQLHTTLSLPIDGKLSNFPMDKTFKYSFVPQSFGFRYIKADNNLFRLYLLPSIVKQTIKIDRFECDYFFLNYDSINCRNITSYILEQFDNPSLLELFEFLQFDISKIRCNPLVYQDAHNRLYRFVLASFKMLRYFSINKLKKYLDYADYTQLTEWYSKMEIETANGTSPDLFYVKSFSQTAYEHTQIYKNFKAESDEIHRKKLEKKSFNNKIFDL